MLLTFCLICLFQLAGLSQDLILYKTIDTTKLYLESYYPDQMGEEKVYPAIIFYFGGGWNGGTRQHFIHHAKYLAKRGLVCFLADYRTRKSHGVVPFECVKDAKSAMRYLRENAKALRIFPDKIIASGGSAGGHLAAATALIHDINDPQDNLSISPTPNALVLFNPVIDNGPGGYGYERIGYAYKTFSPLHNIQQGAPPTLFMLGTKDNLIPVETAKYYQTVMQKVASRCDLKLYEGAGHGFFNYRHFENYKATLLATDSFLQDLGYLEKLPTVEIK